MTKTISKVLAIIMAISVLFSLASFAGAANAISKDDAKAAAVAAVNAQFGTDFTVSSVQFEYVENAEYDDDYGVVSYDVTFYVERADGGYDEYDVEINVETGAVVGYIERSFENNIADEVPGTANSTNFFDMIKAFFTQIINAIKAALGIA